MFSTNLIQSDYGNLNIKNLAFDSFKERLQSTMTALTFFISTGQCACDEIAESNFNYMIAYMSNINYDASKPGAPALSFSPSLPPPFPSLSLLPLFLSLPLLPSL
ncbi:hypothetical protein POW68_18100, partial [Escherichia coli]